MQIVLHVMRIWFENFNDCEFIVHCNNQTICENLRSNIMRNSVMKNLRKIMMLLIVHDIEIHVVWIEFKKNRFVDLLSRNKYDIIVNEFEQLIYLTFWFQIFFVISMRFEIRSKINMQNVLCSKKQRIIFDEIWFSIRVTITILR